MSSGCFLNVAGAIALATCIFTAPALAGVQSFVSTKGSDAGTCASAAAPCRTFAYAHNQTSAGGEILALDAGDYGPVSITKSLSITGAVPGAGVRGGPAGGAAITINSGATGVVDLNGLTLDGLGSVGIGVQVDSAGSVTIKKCTVRSYPNRGVNLFAASPRYLVEDISVANAGFGIVCGGVCAINRVSVDNASASEIASFGSATVSEATLSGGNRGTSGFMRLNRSVVTGNNIGLLNLVDSAGDNFVRGNATNLNAAPNVVGKQ